MGTHITSSISNQFQNTIWSHDCYAISKLFLHIGWRTLQPQTFQPGLFNHEHFNPGLFFHESGVENSGAEAWSWKVRGWNFQILAIAGNFNQLWTKNVQTFFQCNFCYQWIIGFNLKSFNQIPLTDKPTPFVQALSFWLMNHVIHLKFISSWE